LRLVFVITTFLVVGGGRMCMHFPLGNGGGSERRVGAGGLLAFFCQTALIPGQ